MLTEVDRLLVATPAHGRLARLGAASWVRRKC